MSSVLSSLGGVAENSAGEALAFGLGFALGRALEPAGVELSQKAWSIDPLKALDAELAAQLAAEGRSDDLATDAEAQLTGINGDRFAALTFLAQRAPEVAQLLDLWRRGEIEETDVDAGLDKARLPPVWQTHVKALKDLRLDPAVIADAIQRRVLPDPGYLEGALPVDGSTVPILSTTGIDPVTEAAASGIDSDRLGLLAKSAGLPPGVVELLQLLNRGVINEAAFALGVAQGHTRNEWGPFLLALKRRLLTPHEYAELQLRDWITTDDMHTGASLSGMEPADVDLLFKMIGRPLAVHQITTGLERGGSYGGDYAGVPEPYNQALRESNVRPEWGNLAYANRYTYPSAFVLRTLAQAGELGDTTAVSKVLKEIGWPPDFADKVALAWVPVATKGDTHVSKAQTQLWNALHKAYVDDLADDAEADGTLVTLGVVDVARPEVLALWKAERAIHRSHLTAAEIKKTVGLKTWTDAERMARLTQLGYSTEDATTFLAE